MKKTDEKGITLIALIITIIVMLILVGVTVNMVVQGGLFEKAGEAARETNKAIEEEKLLAEGEIEIDGKKYASIDDYLKGKVKGSWYYCDENGNKSKKATSYVTNGTTQIIEVGAQINNFVDGQGCYEVDINSGVGTEIDPVSGELINNHDYLQSDIFNWYVLGVGDDGLLELVSGTPVLCREFYLYGKNGYTKGVNELSYICNELYGPKAGGNYKAYARSITIEDIAKLLKSDLESLDTSDEYGDVWTYKVFDGTKVYVTKDGFTWAGNSDVKTADNKTWYYTGLTSDDFEYYNKDSKSFVNIGTETVTLKDEYIDIDIQQDMPLYDVLSSDDYWLATRVADTSQYGVSFGVLSMNDTYSVNQTLFSANDGEQSVVLGLRPVVSLKSNISLTGCNETGYTISVLE